MTASTLDISFDTFSKAAEAAGYKPTQYSKTGYFVKTADGIRCEFQCTRGGVNSVGYGSSAKVVDALEALLLTPDAEGKVLSPLPLIKRITGSINFSYVSIDKFFELVTATEQLKLEKAVRKAVEAKTPATPKVVKKQTVKVLEAITNEGNPLSPSGSATADEAIAAIDARLAAKASGATKSEADEAAIRAANLKRLQQVGAKVKAQKDAEEARMAELNAMQEEAASTLDEDANTLTAADMDSLPAFLQAELAE